jgi:hypothetical protein
MQIIVRRTGGYGGTQAESRVDTARLDAARRARIEQLLREADASLRDAEPAVGADLMRYEITIQENGTTRSLAWTDDGTFGPVKQLVEEVQQLS